MPALQRRFDDADITWITSRAALPLVAGRPRVDAVAIDGPPDAPWRSRRYDWIIALDDDVEPCAVAAQLEADRRSGAYLDAGGRRVYSDDLAAWFGMGILRPESLGGLAAANQLKRENSRTYGELLYEGLGLPTPVDRPSVVIPRAAYRTAAAWLATSVPHGVGQPVGLNTGAAGRWRFKSWGIDATSALARRLAAAGNIVLLLGGRAEAERNAEICARAGDPRVIAGPDFDLLSFAALIESCAALVCSDSLAMHLAVAAGVPVVAVFGPTSDAEIDLFGRGDKVAAPVPCRRCYLSTCDVTPNCMQTITPEMVFSRIAL